MGNYLIIATTTTDGHELVCYYVMLCTSRAYAEKKVRELRPEATVVSMELSTGQPHYIMSRYMDMTAKLRWQQPEKAKEVIHGNRRPQ